MTMNRRTTGLIRPLAVVATPAVALSVRARLPMRAFILDGHGVRSRLVVDVAHQW